MPKRPYVEFKEVKEKVTIPDTLKALGILEQFTEKKGKWTGVCPIHTHGPKPNDQQFKFDNAKGTWLWKCFGDCDRGGDVISLAKLILNLNDAHVRFWFADNFADRLTVKQSRGKGKTTKGEETKPTASANPTDKDRSGLEVESAKPEPPDKQMPDGIKPLGFYLNLKTTEAGDYLLSRGIDPAVAHQYGVGFCDRGMFAGYMCAPCFRHPKERPTENPVGYVGRWPGHDWESQGKSKYLNGFETSNAVFGLEQAVNSVPSRKWPIIIAESWIKCLNLVSRGFCNVVSTFTVSLSDEQARILASSNRPFFLLCFDGDDAGRRGMEKAVVTLSKLPRSFVNVVELPEGKELDTLTDVELEQLLGWSRPS